MVFVVMLVEVCIQAVINGVAEWGDRGVEGDIVSFLLAVYG